LKPGTDKIIKKDDEVEKMSDMKEKVLQALKENTQEYVSGEALSELMGVSRTAVWKYISELKKEGYVIESSPKKGYRIMPVYDMLNEYEIRWGLKTKIIGRDIRYFNAIDSTNNYAKKIAYEGCDEGTVVVADCQTAGRGRLGRAWDSAGGKGIWMSVVLKPSIAPENVQIITLAASVAVARAIAGTCGIRTGIKWPNDIVLDGKKVCGILTEMNSEMERVNFLVLGIGINVNHEEGDFPDEIKDRATSLKCYADSGREASKKEGHGSVFPRSQIIGRILLELEEMYSKINKGFTDEIIDEWRSYSATLGRKVKITGRDGEYEGTAKDVTRDGKLVVDCTDGITREVVSGEVSVRGLMGYV
jgi:BirA family biotin operon repressor/biotin-[acetyl-CoA-carboxylase] ligase